MCNFTWISYSTMTRTFLEKPGLSTAFLLPIAGAWTRRDCTKAKQIT